VTKLSAPTHHRAKPTQAAKPQRCKTCNGTGDVPRPTNRLTYQMCRACGGTGTTNRR